MQEHNGAKGLNAERTKNKFQTLFEQNIVVK